MEAKKIIINYLVLKVCLISMALIFNIHILIFFSYLLLTVFVCSMHLISECVFTEPRPYFNKWHKRKYENWLITKRYFLAYNKISLWLWRDSNKKAEKSSKYPKSRRKVYSLKCFSHFSPSEIKLTATNSQVDFNYYQEQNCIETALFPPICFRIILSYFMYRMITE